MLLRIQRKRTKGWRMPPNTVSVTRPGPYGNPYTIKGAREAGYRGTTRELTQFCVDAFRKDWATALRSASSPPREPPMPFGKPIYLGPLKGKNLTCFCRLCAFHEAAGGKPFNEFCADCPPCHADPLGEMANR